ncbi:SDR family NAD(P)-dependent oxidoreductase, partial [Hydrogenivirga sp. 128-5-R1-1]|uniref:SDR family NAD(P)-dependent oxidoreductase n=1 Tax=Hydrogenivirga sp. 128-5-R1-1 TaxID=392423 RepID=UPI00015F256C
MNKTCLITGVSKGLGKALALKFKKEGFTVVGVSRSKPDFEIDYHIEVDLAEKTAVEYIYKKFNEKYNHLDILINNAGIGLYDSWENTKEEDLRKLLEINFFKVV